MLKLLFTEARPKQWLKNVLVFAAPGAAGVLTTRRSLYEAIVAFVAMCFAASGTYFFNDIVDRDADRQHPIKRHRPIAAGKISIPVAVVVGTTLSFIAPVLMLLIDRPRAAFVVVVYLVTTLSYTLIWKNIAVLDLIVISSGFVLRAILGAEAVAVPISSWFVLVTAFGSLFIVTGKRYAEARALGDEAGEVRSTLDEYSPEFLRLVLGISCSGALLSYCLWAFDVQTGIQPDLPLLELSVVPVMAAFLRYALVLEHGRGAAPEEVFTSDRVLQILGLVWVLIFGAAVYL